MNYENHEHPHLRVIVADDVQATRHSTCLMLKIIPNIDIVGTAENGRQAIRLAQEHQPDLVFIDINMPELNGIESINMLRKIDPEIKCIVISSERQEETVQMAKEAGAVDYLVKPFTADELVHAIEHFMKSFKGQPARNNGKTMPQDHRTEKLIQIAKEYVRLRRKDDKAVKVLEELASNPQCDMHWLKSLAMLYVYRMEWKKLKLLAEHLDNKSVPIM